MSYWNIQRPYNQDPAVIGTVYFSAERSVTIEKEDVGFNPFGVKAVKAGTFIATVGGKTRFLPRAHSKEDIVAGATSVSVEYPELFKTGDALYDLEPTGQIAYTGVWTGAGTGANYVLTEPSLGIRVSFRHLKADGGSIAGYVTDAVEQLNLESNPLSKYARFYADGDNITVRSRGLQFTLEVTPLLGADTATVTQVAVSYDQIGIVSSIQFEDKQLNLEAATTVDVPEGASIGTLTEEILGIYNHSVDFTDRPTITIKVIDRADRVYLSAVPYFDQQLKALFDRMKFVD